MSNVFDYINWRGDLNLSQDPFNEVDNLILSRFSYFPFDELTNENEMVTISELANRFKKKDASKLPILWPDDIKMFPAMGNTKRFGEMLATKYVNKIDTEEEKQFSAITILMPDDTIYVSYRGTDDTVVGWKEDWNMTFKSHLPSQLDAVKYLQEVAESFPNPIRVGGHSKGGNLAVYAATFSSPHIKNKIINIYNNDAPGFNDEIIQTNEYKETIKKVETYIPQDSVIGRLLNHNGQYTVVKSKQSGIMQHDLYSWQILGNKFECLDEVTNGSKFIDKSLKDWYYEIDIEKRKQVIDIIFQVINTTKVETFAELRSNWLSNAKIILNSYKLVDPESKKMISETISALLKISKNNFIEEHKIKI